MADSEATSSNKTQRERALWVRELVIANKVPGNQRAVNWERVSQLAGCSIAECKKLNTRGHSYYHNDQPKTAETRNNNRVRQQRLRASKNMNSEEIQRFNNNTASDSESEESLDSVEAGQIIATRERLHAITVAENNKFAQEFAMQVIAKNNEKEQEVLKANTKTIINANKRRKTLKSLPAPTARPRLMAPKDDSAPKDEDSKPAAVVQEPEVPASTGARLGQAAAVAGKTAVAATTVLLTAPYAGPVAAAVAAGAAVYGMSSAKKKPAGKKKNQATPKMKKQVLFASDSPPEQSLLQAARVPQTTTKAVQKKPPAAKRRQTIETSKVTTKLSEFEGYYELLYTTGPKKGSNALGLAFNSEDGDDVVFIEGDGKHGRRLTPGQIEWYQGQYPNLMKEIEAACNVPNKTKRQQGMWEQKKEDLLANTWDLDELD